MRSRWREHRARRHSRSGRTHRDNRAATPPRRRSARGVELQPHQGRNAVGQHRDPVCLRHACERAEAEAILDRKRSFEGHRTLQYPPVELGQDDVHGEVGGPEAARTLRPGRALGGRDHGLQHRHIGVVEWRRALRPRPPRRTPSSSRSRQARAARARRARTRPPRDPSGSGPRAERVRDPARPARGKAHRSAPCRPQATSRDRTGSGLSADRAGRTRQADRDRRRLRPECIRPYAAADAARAHRRASLNVAQAAGAAIAGSPARPRGKSATTRRARGPARSMLRRGEDHRGPRRGEVQARWSARARATTAVRHRSATNPDLPAGGPPRPWRAAPRSRAKDRPRADAAGPANWRAARWEGCRAARPTQRRGRRGRCRRTKG